MYAARYITLAHQLRSCVTNPFKQNIY